MSNQSHETHQIQFFRELVQMQKGSLTETMKAFSTIYKGSLQSLLDVLEGEVAEKVSSAAKAAGWRDEEQAMIDLMEMHVRETDIKNSMDLAPILKSFKPMFTGDLKNIAARFHGEDVIKVEQAASSCWLDLAAQFDLSKFEEAMAANNIEDLMSTSLKLKALEAHKGEEVPGVKGEYFKFYHDDSLPDLTGHDPISQCIHEAINFATTSMYEDWMGMSTGKFKSDFTARFTGAICISSEGNYRFRIRSMAGSRLWLDGKLLLDNDGPDDGTEKDSGLSEEVFLEPGFHDFTLMFFHRNSYYKMLIFNYSGPDTEDEEALVPTKALFHYRRWKFQGTLGTPYKVRTDDESLAGASESTSMAAEVDPPREQRNAKSEFWTGSMAAADVSYVGLLDSSEGWSCGGTYSREEWYEFDFGQPIKLLGLVFMALANYGGSNYIEAFTAFADMNPVEGGRVFDAFTSRPESADEKKRIFFKTPVIATRLRIMAERWSDHLSGRFGILVDQADQRRLKELRLDAALRLMSEALSQNDLRSASENQSSDLLGAALFQCKSATFYLQALDKASREKLAKHVLLAEDRLGLDMDRPDLAVEQGDDIDEALHIALNSIAQSMKPDDIGATTCVLKGFFSLYYGSKELLLGALGDVMLRVFLPAVHHLAKNEEVQDGVDDEMGTKYKVGQKVQGLYNETTWYDATIAEIRPNGTYLVAWDDGDTEDREKNESQLRTETGVEPTTSEKDSGKPVGLSLNISWHWRDFAEVLAMKDLKRKQDAGANVDDALAALSEVFQMPKQALGVLCKSYEHDRSLDFSAYENITPRTLATILPVFFPMTKRLFVPPTFKTSIEGIKESYKTLEVAALGAMMSQAQLKILTQTYTESKELLISGEMSHAAFLELVRLFPNPKILIVYMDREVRLAATEIFSQQCPGSLLAVLDDSISDDALNMALQSYKRDCTLDLSKCDGITKVGIWELLQVCPRVERIFAPGCCGCTANLEMLTSGPGTWRAPSSGWPRSKEYAPRSRRVEWKDLAAAFLTIRMAKLLERSMSLGMLHDLVAAITLLWELDVSPMDESVSKRAALCLMRAALTSMQEAKPLNTKISNDLREGGDASKFIEMVKTLGTDCNGLIDQAQFVDIWNEMSANGEDIPLAAALELSGATWDGKVNVAVFVNWIFPECHTIGTPIPAANELYGAAAYIRPDASFYCKEIPDLWPVLAETMVSHGSDQQLELDGCNTPEPCKREGCCFVKHPQQLYNGYCCNGCMNDNDHDETCERCEQPLALYTRVLKAFCKIVQTSESATMAGSMNSFRMLYKGSLYKIFDSLDEEEEWTKVRVGAETSGWYELVEAFHTAYMRPRTIKLAVQVQDATTEELVKGMAKPTEVKQELLRYEVFQDGLDHDCTLCNGTGKQQVLLDAENVKSQSRWGQIRHEVKLDSTAQAVEAWLAPADKSTDVPALPSLRRTISRAKYFSQIGQMMRGECVPCWLCRGTGKVSAWLHSYEAPGEHANEKEDAIPCLVCGDISHYGISTECTHFFCKDCLSGTLEAILEMGQFPSYCPGCRAEASLEGLSKPLAGRIEGPALTFLQRRGVISLDMQFRFLKQQNPGGKDYFRCPVKCGNYLLDRDPEYMHVPKGETEAEGFFRMMRLGECPCGAKVCVNCHQQVFPDEQGKHDHECPDLSAAADADEATLAEMGRVGRKCPNCGNFIEKNGGCNIVMCGTDAHGRLADALAHGGCGFQFEWDTGQAVNTSYIGLDGQQKYGFVGQA